MVEWVVCTLRHGYTLPFGDVLPPLAMAPDFPDAYAPGSERHHALLQQVQALLDKQAIETVPQPGPGFYSRLFVTPERSGDWRTIINLSRLNNFLHVPHFQDGDDADHHVSNEGRPLVYSTRPDGRLPTCAHSTSSPSLPEVPSPGHSLPVPRNALRTGHGSTGGGWSKQ